MTPPLAGKTAAVTGASRGIGAAVAGALAAAGARVALIARDRERLEALAESLPGDPLVIVVDLATAEGITSAVRDLHTAGGPLDIVVNSAGAFSLGRLGELPLDAVTRMVDVNLLAPYRLLHHLVPGMRQRGTGHVVTIGSIADHVIYPENAAYAATKFGARAMHEVLRVELRGTGIRTTLVSPGPVDTEMWDDLTPDARADLPDRKDMLKSADVADAVLWAVTRPAHVDVELVRLGRS